MAMSRAKPRPMPPINEKTLLKFLDEKHVGEYSGKKLPIGRWIKINGPLKTCRNGIHVTRLSQAYRWMNSRCHVVEIRGEHIKSNDKICCREVYIHPALPTWNRNSIELVRLIKQIAGEKATSNLILRILKGYATVKGASLKIGDFLKEIGKPAGTSWNF